MNAVLLSTPRSREITSLKRADSMSGSAQKTVLVANVKS